MESEKKVPLSNEFGKGKRILSDFLQSLTKSQPVMLSYYRNQETKEPDEQLLREAMKNNYLLVRFVATGTELGMSLKTDDPQFFAKIEGDILTINGRLKLDYVPFKMIGTINIRTYTGTGYLVETEDWSQKKI